MKGIMLISASVVCVLPSRVVIAISRALDLDLQPGTSGYTAVFEYSAPHMAGLALSLDGKPIADLPISGTSHHEQFTLVALTIPPGRYSMLQITLRPQDHEGKLLLRSWGVYRRAGDVSDGQDQVAQRSG